MPRGVTLDDLRTFAVARSLFRPTDLRRALGQLAFVQADPIRAPARAQDLILRHRVRNYRAGDLERRYETLGIEEDVFINYGFLPRDVQTLMHPRAASVDRSVSRRTRVAALLDFVRERGTVHPRDVDAHFAHGTVTNYWGGSSNATTHLLELMHYRGLLRIARREAGIRIYTVPERVEAPATAAARRARIDALVDVVVNVYAPLSSRSLGGVIRRLRYAVPQWRRELPSALARAKDRLSRTRSDGIDWYWPARETVATFEASDSVRLLAPFDPIVWDRDRFEQLWGWTYRFEAYTPVAKRKLGYYALPLLWRDRVVGWANLAARNGSLHADIGYVDRKPREPGFARELDLELDRMRAFLGLNGAGAE
jgi:uncharacterized protein